MTTLTVRPVDLRGPLPTGTTVLEASAGTGKTYTIAGFVTRYVAEGHVRLDQLLVVTFGRAATSELRTRVRERLLSTGDALADPMQARTSPDAVVALLAKGDDADVRARRERLTAALAGFDAATVATTHQFCQQVLHGLGTAADLDPGTVLVEDLRDLVTEVADDLYLRWYAGDGAPAPHLGRDDALAVARAAVHDPEAVLEPADADPESVPGRRVAFAREVRAEVERRKRALRILGFDDLLSRVADALRDPVTGETARRRLRERYEVVLVDEFQDTDPVQWDVLSLAFAGHRTLVVIGDPKQAIYAFRGADVRAYLRARAEADSEQTLDTNWRSDPRLLDGLKTLLRGAALGDEQIRVRDVRAGHATPLLGPEEEHPVRVRVLRRGDLRVNNRGIQVDDAREAIADDVAVQVRRMLDAGHEVTPRGTTACRPLEARDVAVLVRKGAQALQVREALLDAGVPCVLTGTSSVFATAAARDWRVLLEALEQPHRTGRVRRLALTSLVGRSVEEVDAGGEQATDALALQARAWGEVLASRGVAALFATLSQETRLAARLLHRSNGERLLTDLRHVAEALHAAALEAQLGLTGLLSWLRRRVEESGSDLDQERSRRLDTDASAVQVVTVHTSKGLEFPVVLVPYGWDVGGGGNKERVPRGHRGDDRVLFVGGRDAPGYRQACDREDEEDAGEELRLLYVAVTRAVSRLVLWWAPSWNTADSPLHRLLFADDPEHIPVSVPKPADDQAVASLRGLGLVVEPLEPADRERAPLPAATPADDLATAVFDRSLDLGWRRTSYTGLTRAAHEAQGPSVGSEPEVAVKDDETDLEATPVGAGDESLRSVRSPMDPLPGGTAFGTLVHAVLEQADLTQDPEAAMREAAEVQLRRRGTGSLTAEHLAAALLPAVSTPLGPLADGLRLRDVLRRDLLAELDFELPLAGGDQPRRRVVLAEVAALLRATLPPDDPVAPYAERLAEPELAGQPLRGYLGGSIDAVVRVGPPDARRYLVVDHKTNRLAPRDEPLTAWHYQRAALDTEVRRAHYPLQALLYEVALHRFLRWRLGAAYDPEQHLGGVLYLFLRGMVGDAVPPSPDGEVPGVWSWRPPAELVTGLSDLLAGAR